MNKWIAEFDLEDGDTMPEHMDLDYMGSKIDLHCRPMWIPVSERLPKVHSKLYNMENSDWVQVTIDISRNGNSDVYVCEAYYCFTENKWYTKRFVTGVVTAWRPLPKPYKAESKEFFVIFHWKTKNGEWHTKYIPRTDEYKKKRLEFVKYLESNPDVVCWH